MAAEWLVSKPSFADGSLVRTPRASGSRVATFLRDVFALVLRCDKSDRSLGRIGRCHEFAQRVKNLLEVIALLRLKVSWFLAGVSGWRSHIDR